MPKIHGKSMVFLLNFKGSWYKEKKKKKKKKNRWYKTIFGYFKVNTHVLHKTFSIVIITCRPGLELSYWTAVADSSGGFGGFGSDISYSNLPRSSTRSLQERSLDIDKALKSVNLIQSSLDCRVNVEQFWTILFVMLKIYFIYKVAGKKSRRAI